MFNFLNKNKLLKYCQWGAFSLAFAVPWSLALTNLAAAWFLLFWLLSANFNSKWKALKEAPISWIAIALAGWMLLSSIWSPADQMTQNRILGRYAKLLALPFIISILTEEKIQINILKAYYIGIVVLMLGSIAQMLGWNTKHIGIRSGITEYTGFVSSVTYGPHVALFIYLSLMYALRSDKWRWLFLIMGCWGVISLFYMTFNRTGFLVFIPLILSFSLIAIKEKLQLNAFSIAAIMIVLMTSLLCTPFAQDRLISIYNEIAGFDLNNLTSSGIRFFYLKFTWNMFVEHPLIGHGVGAFRYLIHDVQKLPGEIGHLWHAHNDYMSLAAETGIVGLILYIGLLFYGLKNITKQQNPIVKFAAIGGLITTSFVGLTDVAIWPLSYMPLIFLALTVNINSANKKPTNPS
jgi:O-antigen ligase